MQVGRPGFKSWLCRFLAIFPRASIASPRFSFPICKMGVEMVSTFQDGGGIQRTPQI